MSEHPRASTKKIRLQIIEALRDAERRKLDYNSDSRNFLDSHDIKPDGLFSKIADYLETYELFLKPKNSPHQKQQRYQCRITYPEETGYPELEIHVTLSAAGEPVRVKVAVHESDTVRLLDQRKLKGEKHEN